MKFFFRFLIGIGLKLLIILHFDFLREPHSAVPLYADECGSLGFVAFSTVSSVSKNTFSTRCQLLLWRELIFIEMIERQLLILAYAALK